MPKNVSDNPLYLPSLVFFPDFWKEYYSVIAQFFKEQFRLQAKSFPGQPGFNFVFSRPIRVNYAAITMQTLVQQITPFLTKDTDIVPVILECLRRETGGWEYQKYGLSFYRPYDPHKASVSPWIIVGGSNTFKARLVNSFGNSPFQFTPIMSVKWHKQEENLK